MASLWKNSHSTQGAAANDHVHSSLSVSVARVSQSKAPSDTG